LLSMNVSKAFMRVRDLHELAMADPEAFSPGDVKALDDIMLKMMHLSVQKKKQPLLHECCGVLYAIELVPLQLAKRKSRLKGNTGAHAACVIWSPASFDWPTKLTREV
jgi:hypothetical protein